jgi:hypothetical protein
VTDSDDGTDVYFGVGASYSFDKVDINADFVRYEVDGVDVDVISIGAAYRF